MRVGMLWFDDSKERTLAQKVGRGARHYEAKYGVMPDLCYVHVSMYSKTPSVMMAEKGDGTKAPVTMKGTNMVLPDHFWYGRTQEN